MKDEELHKYFNSIYEYTYDKTLKYIICNINNLEDVNDIIQEVYFEFYKALTKEKKIDNASSYIIGIASKRLSSHYRVFYKIRDFLSFSNDDFSDIKDNYDLEEDVFSKLEIAEFIKYISSKDIIIGRCIYLYYYFNMSIKEIAEELNIKESNVKNYIYRTVNEYKGKLRKE